MTQTVPTYQVKPTYTHKFKEKEVREIIQAVLKNKLTGSAYNADATSALTREIADDIKQELKDKDWPRYKYVVHVVIGEQKGEGLQIACRAFWDSNTDAIAKEVFENKSLFAVATAYGVYYY
eukprot:jgi/Ulvmu1/5293/UM022_0087.1